MVQTTSANHAVNWSLQKKHDPLKLHQELPLKVAPQNHTFDQCRFPGPNGADECGERGTQLPHDAGFRFTVFFYGCCGWSRCVLSVNQLIWQMYFYYALYIYICSLLYDRYRMTYEVYYLYSISMCLKHLKTILVGLLTVSISRAIGMI